MSEPTMREAFFNERGVRWLANSLRGVAPDFDTESFVEDILPRFPDLGLNERNFLVRDTLRSYLPKSYPRAVKILLRSLGPDRPSEGPESNAGFIVMPLCAFVAEYGLEHVDLSLNALREMTKRFSAEFAIRPFLVRHPDATLAVLNKWVRDRDPRVRRLVSEGTRPRLPWGMRLKRFVENPRPVLALLEKLKDDPELFVRRSVANNLNDIAKDHPALVVETLSVWSSNPGPHTKWLARHSLRTLVKQGHPKALGLQGFKPGAAVKVAGFTLDKNRVRIGERLSFQFNIASAASRKQALMIDYAVHYRKANGRTKPKVFKLKSLTLGPRATELVTKNHSFRPIGIRPFYPGTHLIEIQINGKSMGKASFELLKTRKLGP